MTQDQNKSLSSRATTGKAALGNNDLAAADVATAHSIYRQLGLETAKIAAAPAHGGLPS